MLLWIFFVGDLFSLITMLGMHFHFISGWRWPIWCILYLVGKGVMFHGDVLSMIDMTVAFYILMMLIFHISWFLTYIFAIFLLYKLAMTVLM